MGQFGFEALSNAKGSGSSPLYGRPTVSRPMFIEDFAHFTRPKRRPQGSPDPSQESGEGAVDCLEPKE
jgi:hypothetical protein